MAMGGATQVTYMFLIDMIGNGPSVAVAIIVALAVYVLSLWITKAIVKDDMYQMPVIGKRLRKRQVEENRIYEED